MTKLTTEILIVGAGPAGICAALAAARQGRQVILAGNRPVLGGNSSSEIRVWMRGATGAGNLFSEEMGILGELKMRNQYVNPDGNPVFWDDVQLDTVLQEKNITLLLNTEVFDVKKQGSRVAEVHAIQMGSEKQYKISAQWFIDCTGDGTICAKAGVPYYVGETRYHENHPESQEPKAGVLGNTILYYVRETDHPVAFVPPSYAYDIKTVEALVDRGGRVVNERQSGSDYWWFEFGGLRDTIGDHQEIGLELRRLMMGVWNYIKNSGHFQADRMTLEWVGSFPGKRESRRMDAAHTLTKEELLAGTAFPDSGFYGGWYIDDHPSEGFLTEEENCVQVPVPIYEIPLSTLYQPAVENLLFAGRIIGASREVFFSSRIMNTCALSGQAAGTLACACMAHDTATEGIGAAEAQWTQEQLQRNDMLLFRWLPEPDEISSQADVAVSSCWFGTCPRGSKELPLAEEAFITLPAAQCKELALGISARNAGTLSGTWYSAPIPSRYCPGKPAGEISVPLQEGQETAVIPIPSIPDGFATLVLKPAAGISMACSPIRLPGVLCGYTAQPDYETPVLTLEKPYDGSALTSPYNRPYNGANAWVPQDAGEAWAQLTWKEANDISEIRLYFDPELSMELPSTKTEHIAPGHKFAGRTGMPEQLVRSFALWLRTNDSWEKVYETEENWRRMIVIPLKEAVAADALRLEIHSTWGRSPGAVYALRVYKTR